MNRELGHSETFEELRGLLMIDWHGRDPITSHQFSIRIDTAILIMNSATRMGRQNTVCQSFIIDHNENRHYDTAVMLRGILILPDIIVNNSPEHTAETTTSDQNENPGIDRAPVLTPPFDTLTFALDALRITSTTDICVARDDPRF